MSRQTDDYEVYEAQIVEVPEDKPKRQGPPVHPLGALLTMIMDSLWFVPEGGAAVTGVGVLAVPLLMFLTFCTAFMGVFTIQKFIDQDGWGASFAKAFLMGAIAGVPTFVGGTAVGAALLGWSGVHGVNQLLNRGKDQPPGTH